MHRARILASLFLHPLARADHEVDGAADELEGVAELVLQVTAIREMQRLVHVREEGERRWSRLELRYVVEAAWFAAHGGRVVHRDRALEDRVQLRGADLRRV